MDFADVNRYLVEKVTAIGIRYDFGAGPELLGRRLRDGEDQQDLIEHLPRWFGAATT